MTDLSRRGFAGLLPATERPPLSAKGELLSLLIYVAPLSQGLSPWNERQGSQRELGKINVRFAPEADIGLTWDE